MVIEYICLQVTERYGNSAGPTALAGEWLFSCSAAWSYLCAIRRAKKSTTKSGKSCTITIREPSGHIVCPTLSSDPRGWRRVASLRGISAAEMNERFL